MPDPLALYAAAVGTASLAWQIARELRRLRTRVRVEFEHTTQPEEQPLVPWGGEPPPEPPPRAEYELVLVVVNDGETTEYVRGVSIENAAGTHGFDFGEDQQGDRELPPRGRVFARYRPRTSDDLDLSKGFYGFARLASGRLVKSRLEHLDSMLLEHVAEWNRDAGESSGAR